MTETSDLGQWPQVYPELDERLFKIASLHQHIGVYCLCGPKSFTNRGFTEHIISFVVEAVLEADDE